MSETESLEIMPSSSMWKILMKHRPDLAASSTTTYISSIRGLCKTLNKNLTNPDVVIKEKDAILAHFDKKNNPNVSRSKLSALVDFFDDPEHGVSPPLAEVLKEFRDTMKINRVDYQKFRESGLLTEEQRQNYIPWKDILEKYEALKEDVSPYFKVNAALNKVQFRRAQLYVLLSCFLLIIPRRSMDYCCFKLKNFNNEDNFMLVKGKGLNKKYYFSFSKFKTSWKYGTQVVEIPDELRKIIDIWKTINLSDYMLLNTRLTNKIDSSQLRCLLRQFFEKPKFGTNMIRISWATFRYEKIKNEMNQDSKDFGNSTDMMLTYAKDIKESGDDSD